MTLRTAATAALALAALACGGETDTGRIDTAQEFCQALVAEGARVVVECLESTPEAAALQVAYAYGFHCGVLEGANVAYDAAKGQACLAALQGWSCSQYYWLGEPPPDCFEAFDGLVADGGSCTSPWQCQSLRCDFTACDLPGLCVPTASPGEACEADPDFLPCRVGSDCLDGTCVAWPAPPAPLGEGAPCAAAPCDDGFRCDWNLATPACVARLPDGAACTSSSQCRWASHCDYGTGSGICERDPGPGQACQPGGDECLFGATCSDSGTCTAFPHVGGTCGLTAAGESIYCIDGWCDVDDRCKAFLPLGATCTGPDQCGFDAGCVDGACAPFYCSAT